jgi:hypothetical protein
LAWIANVIGLRKKGGFQRVYRDGERNSAAAPDLVILRSTVRGFKKGSEMARQVTTVSGATAITVHCDFTDKDGRLLLARDIKGKRPILWRKPPSHV